MNKTFLISLFFALASVFSVQVHASSTAYSTAAAGGYDVVSYHSASGPSKGSGHHVHVYEGVTYLFANKSNLKKFKADPAKYQPAYGGYCAFGVSKGKKFYGDPTVWKVVEGKLYLNLDTKVQKLWAKDIQGHIADANEIWGDIKDTPAENL